MRRGVQCNISVQFYHLFSLELLDAPGISLKKEITQTLYWWNLTFYILYLISLMEFCNDLKTRLVQCLHGWKFHSCQMVWFFSNQFFWFLKTRLKKCIKIWFFVQFSDSWQSCVSFTIQILNQCLRVMGWGVFILTNILYKSRNYSIYFIASY